MNRNRLLIALATARSSIVIGSSTYSVTVTGSSLKDSSGAVMNVSGLPIAGTTLTVTK